MWHAPSKLEIFHKVQEKRGRSALLKGYGFHVFSRRLKKGGKNIEMEYFNQQKRYTMCHTMFSTLFDYLYLERGYFICCHPTVFGR